MGISEFSDCFPPFPSLREEPGATLIGKQLIKNFLPNPLINHY